MHKSLFGVLAVCSAVLVAGKAYGDNVGFSQGAVIIPMQSTFQPQGGMVSAYGLVYRVLQANAPGHKNAAHPVTIYIVNNETKASPNRCIPTNFNNFHSGVPSQSDPRWSDGCDFTITNNNEQPVVPVT